MIKAGKLKSWKFQVMTWTFVECFGIFYIILKDSTKKFQKPKQQKAQPKAQD